MKQLYNDSRALIKAFG